MEPIPNFDTTPLQGQAHRDEDLALDILAKRLEQMEINARLEAAAVAEMRDENNALIKQFQQEAARDKQEVVSALSAVMDRLEQVMEMRPKDEKTLAELKQQASRQAAENAAYKRRAFAEMLKTAGTGQIISYDEIPQTLQINGHTITIQPGVNLDVPIPFVEFWEKVQQDRLEGQQHISNIQQARQYEGVQAALSGGNYDPNKQYDSTWDESQGVF
jgi:hypothetical protein